MNSDYPVIRRFYDKLIKNNGNRSPRDTLIDLEDTLLEYLEDNMERESAYLGQGNHRRVPGFQVYADVIINSLEAKQIPMNISSIQDGEAGVIGKLRGKEVRIGRADWLEESGIEIPTELSNELEIARGAGHGVSLLSEEGVAIALFRFIHDDARDGAMELVTSLQNTGIEVQILSGDEQKAVESFGDVAVSGEK